MWGAFSAVFRYTKAYRNPISIIYKVINNRFPFLAYTRVSDQQVEIINHIMAYNLSWFEYLKYNYSVEHNRVELPNLKNRLNAPLEFYGAIYDGDLQGVFGQELYREINCKNLIVLDVGANIGDSSIYFALKGASRVVALEPFPATYELAKKNVEVNGFSDKIFVINGGLGKKNEKISIPNDISSTGGLKAENYNHGIQVEMFTLESIMQKFNFGSNTVLKIDCEGCEYDVFNYTEDKTLRQFGQIIMEYHDGIKDLGKRLSGIGFQVESNSNTFNYCFRRIHQILFTRQR